MSATGRKTKRDKNDFYATPNWTVQRFLEKAANRLPVGQWIESAAGDGAIIRSVSLFGNGLEKVSWTSIELQEKFKSSLGLLSDKVWIGNFMSYSQPQKAKVCITNPPYKFAEAMIKHAQTQADVVVMLLRLNFLASEKRRDWMAKNTPDVYVLPNRPSFRGGGTDATEYAWFLWDNKSCGKITILENTPKNIRMNEKKALNNNQTI